jgi:hypothetical protein
MVEPASAPEYSVSVYSETPRDNGKYFATYLIADRSLWQASDVGRRPQEVDEAKTRRIDAQIPKQVAEKLRQVWMGMLSGRHRPRPMREEDAARTTDATVAEFSIQVSDNQVLYGEVDADFPPGSKTRSLLDIANDLIAYCKAEPTDRPAIASKIGQEADRLLAKLK